MRIFHDEALLTSPINAALEYSWCAIKGNGRNTLIVAFVLMIFLMLSLLPIVGFIASVAQAIMLYALGYWVVDRLKESSDLEAFKVAVFEADTKSMMVGLFGPAAGFYLGFMMLSILMVVFAIAIFWASGGFETIMSGLLGQHQSMQTANPEAMYAFYFHALSRSVPAISFIAIVALFFGYLWPLVYGYALFQRNFSDAFNAVFMVFSQRFWRAALTGRYFRLVTLWTLIFFGVGIVIAISVATFVLFPVGALLLIWMSYFNAIVSAQAYNMSDDI